MYFVKYFEIKDQEPEIMDYLSYYKSELESIEALTIKFGDQKEKRIQILLDSFETMYVNPFCDYFDLTYILANISYEYNTLDKFQEADIYAEKAIKLAYDHNNLDAADYAKLLLAISKHQQQKYQESIDILSLIKSNFEQTGNYLLSSTIYSNLTLIYSELGQFEIALKYGLFGLGLSEKVGNKQNLAYIHKYLAKIYLNLGFIDKSIEFPMNLFEISLFIKSKSIIIETHIGFGEINKITTIFFFSFQYSAYVLFYLLYLNFKYRLNFP